MWKMVSAAALAVAACMGAANAQSASDFGGPRELPPASFSGQQYVDSRGCVFLRAGFGGRVNWVPRVSRDRRQLCGYPPSLGGDLAVAEIEPAPRAAEPKPTVMPSVGKPMDTVASIKTPPRIRKAAPVTVAEPVAQPRVVVRQVQPAPAAPVTPEAERGKGAVRVTSAPGPGKIGCYKDAPVAERFAVRGGGSIVMCTTGNGDLASARPPRVVGGPAAVAPSGYLEVPRQAATAPSGGEASSVVVSTQSVPEVPKGYKKAWQDDRLNPNRAKGTAEGWADQDQVWTRKVPAKLVADTAKPHGTKKVVKVVRRVVVSSKGEAAPAPARQKAASSGATYVQVGTFGQPANAEGAHARLAGLGLPVARSKITKGGKPLQIVLAGPFGSGAEAQAALSAARRAGFSDAFIR